jgi:hypothetical protein
MERRNKPKSKTYKTPGRRGVYDSESTPQRAYEIMRMGLTERELAIALGVNHSTIDYWKKAHPEFVEAIKQGGSMVDDYVEQALFHRAIGYSHRETKFFKIPVTNYAPDGTILNTTYKIITVDTERHYPPDPTSAIFWLKNRRRGEWADVNKTQLDISAEYTFKQIKELDINSLSPQEQKLLFDLNLKQLNSAQNN